MSLQLFRRDEKGNQASIVLYSFFVERTGHKNSGDLKICICTPGTRQSVV